MEFWLWVAIGVLAAAIVILLGKLYLMRRSAREIEQALEDRLLGDTNTLIDISSGDRYLRSLAASINLQLKSLREQRHRFQQGDMELKRAVTNISHDLRTPLTAICGYLDLLAGEEVPERGKRYLAVIQDRVKYMSKLTEELFHYSAFASAQTDRKKQKVLVNEVLEESIASFYVLLQENNIVPEITIPEEKVFCELDRASLARVFSNLLHNAVKYSDGDLVVVLSDTGEIVFENAASGLDGVEVEKLFDRFYTVETAKKSTGLGLAIARTLVAQMGGTIAARYENGRLSVCIRFDFCV